MAQEDSESLRDDIVAKLMERLREHLSDAMMADKKAVVEKLIRQLLDDATVQTIMK